MRRFAWSPGEVATGLGTFIVLAALIGTPAGGILSDRVTARWGLHARYMLLVIVAMGGIVGIPVGLVPTAGEALASASCLMLVGSAMATITLTTVLDILPLESRGFATSTLAFNNIIVGLGLGPTLVALVTDKIFLDPRAVGRSMSCVIAPAVAIGVLMYAIAMLRARRLQPASRTPPTAMSNRF